MIYSHNGYSRLIYIYIYTHAILYYTTRNAFSHNNTSIYFYQWKCVESMARTKMLRRLGNVFQFKKATVHIVLLSYTEAIIIYIIYAVDRYTQG